MLVAIGYFGWRPAGAAGGLTDSPAWSAPAAKAVKRVSDTPAAQHEPDFLNNLDCTLVDFRVPTSANMQTGCFTETALGYMDSDFSTVIFNGTDEGLKLLSYAPNQVLVPWPGAAELVSLSPVATGGTYISLYTGPTALIKDQRDWLFRLTAKQLTGPANLQLTGPSGQRLIINPQTLAFSDNGSWLVAETLNGAFIRINLATLDMVAFAPSFAAAGNPALFKSQVSISHDGRFAAISNEEYKVFKIYDLNNCSGVRPDLQPQNCQSYDYRPFLNQQLSGLQTIRHVRFVNENLLSFEAITKDQTGDGVYLLAPQEQISFLTDYLALGDSFTSGEGAFDYLSGTDTATNSCHLSVKSYPLLITRELFSPSGGHSVACSGAKLDDLASTSDSYKGQVKNPLSYKQLKQSEPALLNSVMTNFLPGYVAQNHFAGQYQPRIISASVAGNDIGFGDILEECLTPHMSRHLNDNVCFNTYEDRLELKNLIDRTVPRWTALYKQLLKETPGTRVYAIGYPDIVDDTGSCALNVQLNQSERQFARELVDYINQDMRKAADKAGVYFVDISDALNGHRLCETNSNNVAVNGITAGRDSGVLGIKMFANESYHPNALGQELMKQAILRQTKNLTAVTTKSPANNLTLVKGPKTGRAVSNRLPEPGLTQKIVKAGQKITIKVGGAKSGLKPGTGYQIRLDGSNGQIIGTADSDGNGDINTIVTIPGNNGPGGHTIDVTGDNQAGEPVDVTQPVVTPVSDNDFDGDGLPDNNDSCPTALNSGADADQDGIDDVCDGSIGTPPVPPATNQAPAPVAAITGSGINMTPGQGSTNINLRPPVVKTAAVLNSRSGTASPVMRLALTPESKKQAGLRVRLHVPVRDQGHAMAIGWPKWLEWMMIAWLLLFLLYILLKKILEPPKEKYQAYSV